MLSVGVQSASLAKHVGHTNKQTQMDESLDQWTATTRRADTSRTEVVTFFEALGFRAGFAAALATSAAAA